MAILRFGSIVARRTADSIPPSRLDDSACIRVGHGVMAHRPCKFVKCELEFGGFHRRRGTAMRIVSKARLREFWERPGRGDAEGPLCAWHSHVSSKSVRWESWSDVKADFATASILGNCTIFNIGGNKYRLVTRILYASQKVFVLKVMKHSEYDENKWPDECGCFDPPPSKPKIQKKIDVNSNGRGRREMR